MGIDKGSKTLNYIFAAFTVLSAIKIGSDLYLRYKESQQKKKPCNCKNKN